jgi:hypothetical protein
MFNPARLAAELPCDFNGMEAKIRVGVGIRLPIAIATPRTQFRAASVSERIRSLTLAALNGGSDFVILRYQPENNGRPSSMRPEL